MHRAGGRRPNTSKSNRVDKLLSFPGITQAIALVKTHAQLLAVEETVNAAERGELGPELRDLANDVSLDAIETVLEYGVAQSFMEETADEILDSFALEAGQKIAELWELSEPAGERLSEFIYWGETIRSYAAKPFWLPSVLVVNTRKPEAVSTLHTSYSEFLRRNAVVVPTEGMKDGHVYLDVTYLPYKGLSLAYEAVLYCRDKLGIHPDDLREGAPASLDGQMALKCAELEKSKGAKEAARQLGFRIYTSDNPSGSYPLFRKYSKTGRRIQRRLAALDEFLYGLEDNLGKT